MYTKLKPLSGRVLQLTTVSIGCNTFEINLPQSRSVPSGAKQDPYRKLYSPMSV